MPSSGFVPESANRVCLLLSILSLSIPFILYLFALGSALRVFLPRCAQLSVNDALLLPHHFVTCAVFVTGAVNFLSCRARFLSVFLVFFGGSCREPTLWNTGAELLPSSRHVTLSQVGASCSFSTHLDGGDSACFPILGLCIFLVNF